MMFSRLYERPLSRESFARIASLSSGDPGTGVYFVYPSSKAFLATALMWSGVSKSGSPAPNPTTSIPWAFIALALLVMASVGAGWILPTLRASFFKVRSFPRDARFDGVSNLLPEFPVHPVPDQGGDQVVDLPAESRDLLGNVGADIGIALPRHHEDGVDLGGELPVHVRHLELVLEIGNGPEAPDHHVRIHLSHVFDEKPPEGVHLHVGVGASEFPEHAEPLGRREHGVLAQVFRHCHDHPGKDPRRPVDDVEVAERRGVERPGVHCDGSHPGSFSTVKIITFVPPYRRSSARSHPGGKDDSPVLSASSTTTVAPGSSTPAPARSSAERAAIPFPYGGSRKTRPNRLPRRARTRSEEHTIELPARLQ